MDTSGAARLLGDIRDITRFASRVHFRSIGGSFGVSLFGAVFNQKLIAQLAHRPGATGTALTSGGGRVDPAALRQLPAPVRTGFLESMAFAICQVFIWAIVFAVAVHCSRCSSGRSRCAAATTPQRRRGHRRAGRPGEHRPRRAGVAVSSDRVGT